jgi:hypothetical protein
MARVLTKIFIFSRVCVSMAGGNLDKTGVRVLGLHSFRTNKRILEKQLRLSGWLQRLEPENVTFTFPDAPHEASGPIPEDVKAFGDQGTYREWWNADQDRDTKAWHYHGSDESLSYLESVWDERGPFDVILGFSQGAAMAALFSGMLKSKEKALPKCIVCISGIKVRDSRFDGWYEGIRQLPSFHLYGSHDPVKIYTNGLIRCFEDPVVVQHERGHVVPKLGVADEAKLVAFIRRWAKGAASNELSASNESKL